MAEKYIRQRDSYNCGPVAIINTIKFLKGYITYSSLSAVRKLCNCKYPDGTGPLDLEKALIKLGISFERRIRPNIKHIDKHIKKGGAVLINYCIDIGHYSLCIGKDSHYILVNDLDDITVSGCDELTMRYMIECGDEEKYWCWFIFPGELDGKKIAKYCGQNS